MTNEMMRKQIKPINNNGNILIRFCYGGNRYCFAPIEGGKYYNPWDLKRAEAIAIQIMIDFESNHFDSSLTRYKLSKNDTINNLNSQTIDLKTLWQKYTDYKKLLLAPSTIEIDYKRRVNNTLKKMPVTGINQPLEIRDWLLTNTTLEQTKKILTQLNACCKWAKRLNIISNNPFDGMVNEIKIIKKNEEEDINPFTAKERDEILLTFKSHKQYCYYHNLVAFLFYTGCRPCEAIPLIWDDVKAESIIFNKSYVEGYNKNRLKTQKRRLIKLNPQVKELINSVKKSNDLIFPAPKGGLIDWHNFSNRAWAKILSTLPHIEYRNPYQCRHTFITLAIGKGVALSDLAKHCGNSPKMILERYAGVSRDFVMPVF